MNIRFLMKWMSNRTSGIDVRVCMSLSCRDFYRKINTLRTIKQQLESSLKLLLIKDYTQKEISTLYRIFKINTTKLII
jgi:hypothetical protein